jgi:hypothetical protein
MRVMPPPAGWIAGLPIHVMLARMPCKRPTPANMAAHPLRLRYHYAIETISRPT